VIWPGGSGWARDDGKVNAGQNAAQELNQAGYALAGVSIRSSAQVKFPGQLHDIKAAIRWLRANAGKYNLDPSHIAVIGTSSGGWAALMAAVTGDNPELEGTFGPAGVPGNVQAAVAFYPPTNFLTADAWAPTKCVTAEPGVREWMPGDCRTGDSPESRLLGCLLETCPERVAAADPTGYISAADPPIMILHGQSDPAVPHNQGERIYMALNKACKDAVFVSLPKGEHGPSRAFLSDDAVREAATIRSTSSAGCVVQNPKPYTPSWRTILEFLDRSMK
jgi:acetyl esterase/lipase